LQESCGHPLGCDPGAGWSVAPGRAKRWPSASQVACPTLAIVHPLTLVRRGGAAGVFLLEDIAGDLSSPPAGVAVFALDHDARTARLRKVRLAAGFRQEQLIAGATMLLRADGFETIET
jgi:hypothetical protein